MISMRLRHPHIVRQLATWSLEHCGKEEGHTSPDGSTANEANCTGVGVVMVRKLRYLSRSQARTVPSRLALTTAPECGRNARAVTGAVCSAKVMKHMPVAGIHILTCMQLARLAGSAQSGLSSMHASADALNTLPRPCMDPTCISGHHSGMTVPQLMSVDIQDMKSSPGRFDPFIDSTFSSAKAPTLASSAPVASKEPSGEKATAAASK